MIDRRAFTTMGLSAAALAAIQRVGFAQQAAVHAAGGVMEKCARACSDCQRSCDFCGNHCAELVADGKKEHLSTVKSCQDCADMCSAASQIVSRMGPYSDSICKVCAVVCNRCAKECEKFASHKVMADCAKECRDCEKACNEMVKHIAK